MRDQRRSPFSLPPLNWLRAFEAAARHSSFKKAAEELNVTPAAISQHVKALEEYYGVKLFTRKTRSMKLTRIGELSSPFMSSALKNFSEACDIIKNDMDREWIVITAPLSFCMKWLVPRLELFNEIYPDIEVRIDATDNLLDLNQGQADIGVRYGDGDYPDLRVSKLVNDSYCAIASPALLERHGGLESISQISNYRLLHTDWRGSQDLVPSWEMWFRAAGVGHLETGKGHKFSNEMMAIDAAVSELGIALVSRVNAEADLAAGNVVTVLDNIRMSDRDFQYYLVRPQSEDVSKAAESLFSWLCKQGAANNGI